MLRRAQNPDEQTGPQAGLVWAARLLTRLSLALDSANPSATELRVAARQLVEGVQQMGFVDKAADTMALQKVG